MAVAEWKTNEIKTLTQMMSTHPVVGIINIGNIPAPQLQKMRKGLHGKASLRVTKNSLLSLALKQVESKIKGIEKISEAIVGETAIIATEKNPFKLYKEIERTKTKAPAKGGEIAQSDIIIEKGETPFKPGPIVGELQSAGIPAAIEGGAVVIKQTKTIVKKGEKIPIDVAKMLTRLEIYPLEIGLDLRAVYENKIIFTPDTLKVDSDQMLADFQKAALVTFNIALKIGYTTKTTITPLLRKAYWDVVNLAKHCNILIPETTKILFTKAHLQAQVLQSQLKSSIEDKIDTQQTKVTKDKKEQPPKQKQEKEQPPKQKQEKEQPQKQKQEKEQPPKQKQEKEQPPKQKQEKEQPPKQKQESESGEETKEEIKTS
jgi:large subunit ribosomal protein L10